PVHFALDVPHLRFLEVELRPFLRLVDGEPADGCRNFSHFFLYVIFHDLLRFSCPVHQLLYTFTHLNQSFLVALSLFSIVWNLSTNRLARSAIGLSIIAPSNVQTPFADCNAASKTSSNCSAFST